tara:strand:+ start:5518 stop:5742 length:225 start_codon:yes stop_codon:yes gene_type:complete
MSKMNEYEEDLFELKYLEEISVLFNELKEIDNFNGLNLLNDNYCEFYEFIKENVYIYELTNDSDDSELEEENNI